jgi:tetratricopeptide (TPR) repeat protein
MIKLTCPQCNGALELPDNLGVAHCMYCGTKILLQQPDIAKDKETIQRNKELCRIALESKNYNEAIQFSNHILEMDTKDVDAWIYKATATFGLTTEANNRYDEAKEYLKKAEEISPGDARIRDTLNNLTYRQADWFIYLGKKEIERGDKIRDNFNRAIYHDPLAKNQAAKIMMNEITHCYCNAMIGFFKAANLLPRDINPLLNIEDLAKKVNWLDWESTDVFKKAMQNLQMFRVNLEAK